MHNPVSAQTVTIAERNHALQDTPLAVNAVTGRPSSRAIHGVVVSRHMAQDNHVLDAKDAGTASNRHVAASGNAEIDVSTDAELAALAKAIANPTRIKILRILLSRDWTVCGAIVDELPLAQSTVSQHLKVLKQEGFIRGDVDGPKPGYCVNPEAIQRLKTLVGGL